MYELNITLYNLAELVAEMGRLDHLASAAKCTTAARAARSPRAGIEQFRSEVKTKSS